MKLPNELQIKRACAVVANTFEDFPKIWHKGSFAANEEHAVLLTDYRACRFCAIGGVATVLYDTKKFGGGMYELANHVEDTIDSILVTGAGIVAINDIYGRKAAIAALREVAHGG